MTRVDSLLPWVRGSTNDGWTCGLNARLVIFLACPAATQYDVCQKLGGLHTLGAVWIYADGNWVAMVFGVSEPELSYCGL
jgi:hypothetical protein